MVEPVQLNGHSVIWSSVACLSVKLVFQCVSGSKLKHTVLLMHPLIQPNDVYVNGASAARKATHLE